MGSLGVYYLPTQKAPLVISTVEEVDTLIDRVCAESPPAAPILMDIHLLGDQGSQGLDVGITSNHGVIRYSGRDWPRGVVSTGENPADNTERPYFFMGHWREFTASAEISLDAIKKAVKEFLMTDGARPTCVQWQPDPLWGDLLDD